MIYYSPIMCQTLYHVLWIKWQMRDLAPFLMDLMFYDWVYQSEFFSWKKTEIILLSLRGNVIY